MEEYEVYNPKNVDVEDLPVIYGFNNGGSPGWMTAFLVAEDGTGLGSHICSNESFMRGDLGILKGSRPDRHETFREHYPEGYRMDFISHDEIHSHEGFQAAIKLNQSA